METLQETITQIKEHGGEHREWMAQFREHLNITELERSMVVALIDSNLIYVYSVAGMMERQTDVEIIKKQDYIETPNYNGYRSLHLDIRVPVYLSDRTEHLMAEIQIRTIAMDFWASLEHDIRYKADKSLLPERIDEEMLACSGKIAEINRQVQDMPAAGQARAVWHLCCVLLPQAFGLSASAYSCCRRWSGHVYSLRRLL